MARSASGGPRVRDARDPHADRDRQRSGECPSSGPALAPIVATHKSPGHDAPGGAPTRRRGGTPQEPRIGSDLSVYPARVHPARSVGPASDEKEMVRRTYTLGGGAGALDEIKPG